MNTARIERAAVRAVEDYIYNCHRLESYCQSNDRTPLWDGDIYIYKSEKEHTMANFIARVPLMIQGTTNTNEDSYRIDREYLRVYQADRGCVLFMVHVDKETYKSIRTLYAMLSLDDVNALLQHNTQTIRIELKEVPAIEFFEKELINFATKRNQEKISVFDINSINPLKEDCEKLRDYLSSINPNQQDYFTTLLDYTKDFIGTTFDWSERFTHIIESIIDISQSNHIEDYALLRDIATKLADFLKEQNNYSLAEKYLKIAVDYSQALEKQNPEYVKSRADSRSNLMKLYKETNSLDEIEELSRLSSYEENSIAPIEPLANEYYSLAEKNEKNKRHRDAQENYINALNIYLVLEDAGKENGNRWIKRIIVILEQLFKIHKVLRDYTEAKQDIDEAIIFNERIKNVFSSEHRKNKAFLLAGSAFINETVLKKYSEAEKDYKDSLELYNLLNEEYNNEWIEEKADMLVSLGDYYLRTRRFASAETMYNESLDSVNSHWRKNAFQVNILYKLACLHAMNNKINKAENYYNEAKELQNKLSDSDRCSSDAAKTEALIALIRYYLQKERDKAVAKYKEALNLIENMINADKEANIYFLIDFLENSAEINSIFSSSAMATEMFVELEPKYNSFLEICKTLNKRNKDKYIEETTAVHNNLADLYYSFGKYDLAEKEYKEVLDKRREIAVQSPIKKNQVALTLCDLGKLHDSLARYNEAISDYREALELFQELAGNDNRDFDTMIANLHRNLGKLYATLKRDIEAKYHLDKAANLSLNLSKKESDGHRVGTAGMHENKTIFETTSFESPQIKDLYTEKSKQFITQVDESYQQTKIKVKAAHTVEDYIWCCPRLEPFIQTNDKTPFWDGEIHIHSSKNHKVKNFIARVPLQIKGTTNTDDNFYRIDRDYLEAYRGDGGCVFFMVQEDKDTYKPQRILYALLSLDDVNTMLQRNTQTIKIDLKVVPEKPLDFEEELIRFANERRREPIDNPAPKEIADLVNHFNDLEQHLNEVEDNGVKIELKSFIDTIKGFKNDGTVGWRDSFVFLSGRALDLAIQHIKGYDFLPLQQGLGKYLYEHKYYHQVEDYYVKSLNEYRKRSKANPAAYFPDVAMTLNNLAVLHSDLNQYPAAEKEYYEALDIYRKLSKDNPDAYLPYVANTLNNLAVLHKNLNQYPAAEKEYNEALDIRRKFAKDNPDAYLPDVATTLNNLAVLHSDLNMFDNAEAEYQEALHIRRELVKANPDAYIPDVAMTLNNLAVLHRNLNRFDIAEAEYKEALDSYRKLAKDNPAAFLPNVATTLNNLAVLHRNLNRVENAEAEYQEALEIYRKLAKANPAAYIPDVAMTLNNLTVLHSDLNMFDNAEAEYKEALEIYRKLAKDNPAAYLPDVAMTLNNLAILHSDLNMIENAEAEYKEALYIRRELAKENPDAFLPDVATILFNIALFRLKEHRKEEAKEAAEEAFDIFESLAKASPLMWVEQMHSAQNLLHSIYRH